MADQQFLLEADWTLSKCGQALPPAHNVRVVYRMKDFLVQTVVPPALQPGSTQTFTKLITGDTTWELRAIQSNWFSASLVYLQIQLADGSYLSNSLMDTLPFSGYGSNRWTATKPVECPSNSKIIIGFDTNLPQNPPSTTAQNVTLFLEGAYKYYVQSQTDDPDPVGYAEGMARYLGNPNQNILAPSWVQGYGPATPQGWEDVWHTYTSGGQVISGVMFPGTTIPLAGSTVATATIQLERASDFVVRKFYFWLAKDATVTSGAVLGRIRISSGYAVTNDYLDLARYLGGAMVAHDLNIKAAESIVFDLNLVDFAGTGNFYFQAYAEGCKRYPRTASALQVPLQPSINQEVIVPAGGGPVRTPPPSLRGYRR
jgi:hypothetical protein